MISVLNDDQDSAIRTVLRSGAANIFYYWAGKYGNIYPRTRIRCLQGAVAKRWAICSLDWLEPVIGSRRSRGSTSNVEAEQTSSSFAHHNNDTFFIFDDKLRTTIRKFSKHRVPWRKWEIGCMADDIYCIDYTVGYCPNTPLLIRSSSRNRFHFRLFGRCMYCVGMYGRHGIRLQHGLQITSSVSMEQQVDRSRLTVFRMVSKVVPLLHIQQCTSWWRDYLLHIRTKPRLGFTASGRPVAIYLSQDLTENLEMDRLSIDSLQEDRY